MSKEGDAAAAEMAKGLADLSEGIEPFFETANGMRAKLEADGWSPTAAEQVAQTWLMGAMAHLWLMAAQQ